MEMITAVRFGGIEWWLAATVIGLGAYVGGIAMARPLEPGAIHWSVGTTLPSPTGGISKLGLAGLAAGHSNGELIVAGGTNFPHGPPWTGGAKAYYREIFVYHLQGTQLRLVNRTSVLPYRVAYAASVSTPHGVVVIGGQNARGALRYVSILQWNATAAKVIVHALPRLPAALTDGMAAVQGNTVYFAGGENAHAVSDVLYALRLGVPGASWRVVDHLPHPVTHAVLLPITRDEHRYLYLVGGRDRGSNGISKLYSSVYAYRVRGGSWVPRAPLPYVLSAQTGVAWKNQQLLIFSGDRGVVFHETQVLMNEIAHTPSGDRREALVREKNRLQETHPGFSRSVLAYDIAGNRWIQLGALPVAGQVTTTAVKWEHAIAIPGGEIRAGVRTSDITLGLVDGSSTERQ